MRRTNLFAAVLGVAVAGFALAGCNRSSSQGQGVTGVTSTAGMVSDPERELVYLGDATAGRVVALSTSDGSTKATLLFGTTIGGLAVDHCVTKLFVSVTGGRRIDVVDCATFTRTASIALAAIPYAVAAGVDDHVIVATSSGLIDLNVLTHATTTLRPKVDAQAMLCSNRAGDTLFVLETVNGSVSVERLDLSAASGPPVTSPADVMPGRHVGIALSYAEDRLYVATDGSSGVFALDAASLVVTGLIVVGPDLAAIAINPTSTRLYYSHGDLDVSSLNLDQHAHGASYVTGAAVKERGLSVAANGLSLLAHDADQSVQSYYLFDVRLNGPGAVRQTKNYTVTIQGPPNAVYYFFASGDPGYVYLDPPTSLDPRFLDLALGAGFFVLSAGQLDANGQVVFNGTVPAGFPDEATIIFQAVAQSKPGRHFAEIGNPLMIRFLAADCTK
jgi:hypothetical protein